MTPSSPVFRVAWTTAPAAVLALTVALFPGGPAAADTPEPAPLSTTSPDQCFLLLCGPGPAGTQGPAEPTRTQEPEQRENPPAPPVDPVPAPPEQSAPSVAPPAVDPVPVAPSAGTEETAGSPEPSTSAARAVSSPPPTGASSGQDRNTPVPHSVTPAGAAAVTPAGAAAVTPAGDPGPGGPAFLPITAGVLLLGIAAASFIWWGRNQFRVGAH